MVTNLHKHDSLTKVIEKTQNENLNVNLLSLLKILLILNMYNKYYYNACLSKHC